MIDLVTVVHGAIPALIFVLPAFSIAYGQSKAATTASQSIDTQPQAADALRKNFILGIALSETAAILTGVIAIFLVTTHRTASFGSIISTCGIFAAAAIPSVCVGILSYKTQCSALIAAARQPFFAGEILRLMLITLALMQTSVILGFILAFLIQNQISATHTIAESAVLLAGGLAFGFGSIGPLIGLSNFSSAVCETIGMNRTVYSRIVSFTLVSQGLIEAPILFSLVIALLILAGTQPHAVACLAAAIAIGLSTFGPGIASGKIAQAAAGAIGKQPESYGTISRLCLFAQTLIDTAPIYGMIVALALLLFQ